MDLSKLARGKREKVLIVGTGRLAKEVGRYLIEHRKRKYELVGFIDEDRARIGETVVNPKVIGSPDQIPALVAEQRIGKVIVALPERRGKLQTNALMSCRLSGVRFLDGFSFYEGLTGKILIEELHPGWLIFSEGFDRRKVTSVLKRVMDLILAMLGLVLSAPFFLIIPLLIKLDSWGPIIHRQTRVGEGEKPFVLLKFRSMEAGTETKPGPIWAQKDDPRITRVGRWLRKRRLDEIPQLFNVLKGDMSFVGSRPVRPSVVAALEEQIPYYSLRHTVKPGITGWAQVRYRYAASVKDQAEKLCYDLYYIKNMSLALDMRILFETVKIVLFAEGAR